MTLHSIYLVYRLDLPIHGSNLPLHGPIRDLEWRVTGTNPILDPIVFSVFGTTTEGLWRFTQLSKSSSDMIQQFHELDVHRKLSLDGSNPRFRPIFKDFTHNSTVLVGSLSRI